ncbi:hypothetical protein BGZ60DRAFT_394071 [Tricladium varicosporioides]|nr:hypothetical protein BGZ60DRAFT_394071 [Hymenoscyphus varicosporioides]
MSSHSTPSKSTKSAAKGYKPSHSSTPLFTPMMQDRQARNKEPYSSSDDSDSPYPWDSHSKFDAYGNDSYSSIQLRRDAAVKLDNPEIVMMLAAARNDSIPATRLYLTKIMCGFITQEDIDAEAAGLSHRDDDKAKSARRKLDKGKAAER